MSTVRLKLIKTDSEFLEVAATMIVDNSGRKFYYMPYWMENVGEGMFVQHSFEDLPVSLKEYLESERIS